jgi:hypothetical protein
MSIDFVLSLQGESTLRVYENRMLSVLESNKEEGNELNTLLQKEA